MKTTILQKIAYLLTRTLGVGVVKGHKLLDNADLSSLDAFIASSKALLSDKDYAELVRAYDSVDVDLWERSLGENNVSVVAFGEKDYPESLSVYGDMPVLLYCKGNVSLLNAESLAVVGTRYPTHYGVRATQEFVNKLSSRFCIVSGMARGVDSVAHVTALENGARTSVSASIQRNASANSR